MKKVDKERHKESMERENAPNSRQGQPIWHVYSRRKKLKHVEERKKGLLKRGYNICSFAFPLNGNFFVISN